MIKVLCVIAVLCICLSLAVVLCYRKHTKKVMKSIDYMLDRAINGSFTEETFDETMLSALEGKLMRYLSISEISAKKVDEEKNHITELLADISHQTKTPVANLMLYGQLLQEEGLSPAGREYVEEMNRQVDKLQFLVSGFVKLSRLETGILTLHPECSPLFPMLEAVGREFAGKAEQKGLSLTIEDTEASAYCDEKWTREALGNIVDNAIKYTEQGSVTLRVKAYEMFTCIEVRDTGIGIPEKEQAGVFTRFYRSPRTAKEEGIGLGLYLARQILSEENGYIRLSSRPGEGSVFAVFLPSGLCGRQGDMNEGSAR